MMYGSWDIERDRQFFVILNCFLSFYPLWTHKIKIKKKKKKKNTCRYYHFINVYHKQHSYDVWFLRYEVQRTEVFVILDFFLAFYPSNNPKIQNFEKMKTPPGGINILQRYNINDNYTMYGFRDTKHVEQNFLSFWTIFCWKIKILKKWKKNLQILSFYTCVPQMIIIWCMVSEIWSVMDIICYFRPILPFDPPPKKTPKN